MGISPRCRLLRRADFEANRSRKFRRRYFRDGSRIGGAGINVIAPKCGRASPAFPPRNPGERPRTGVVQVARDGEFNLFNPETVPSAAATSSGTVRDLNE